MTTPADIIAAAAREHLSDPHYRDDLHCLARDAIDALDAAGYDIVARQPCPECGGYGRVVEAGPEYEPTESNTVGCHACDGTGYVARQPDTCPTCKRAGYPNAEPYCPDAWHDRGRQ